MSCQLKQENIFVDKNGFQPSAENNFASKIRFQPMAENIKTVINENSSDYPHLSILFRHILNGYLDDEDCLSILSVSKIDDFDVAKLLAVDLTYNYDYVLEYASIHGYLDVVQYLADKGDIVNNKFALVFACRNGHLPVAQYLVEKVLIYMNTMIKLSETQVNLGISLSLNI